MNARERRQHAPTAGPRGPGDRPLGTRLRRACLAAFLLGAGALVAGQPGAKPPLHLSFTRAANSYGNDADVQSAIGKWTEVIGNALEHDRRVEYELTDGAEGVVRAFASGWADFAVLSPFEFIEAEGRLAADPFVTYEANGEVDVTYVLVAGSTIRSVADLHGKRVTLLMPTSSAHPARLWLDVGLREAGLGGLDTAVSEAREVRKPSQVLMPVFFGQADAALLPRAAYATSCELNPDLGRKLHVVATSPSFARLLVIVARKYGPDDRARWLAGLARAVDDPTTRQLFTIFKIDRFAPCTLQNLANVRAVATRHAQLVRAERQRPQAKPARKAGRP